MVVDSSASSIANSSSFPGMTKQRMPVPASRSSARAIQRRTSSTMSRVNVSSR